MATGQLSQNRVYLFRLQTLIIDGGTTVVRNIFDQKTTNIPLNILLHQEKGTINRLRAGKYLTQAQFDLLFPQNGQAPTTADFDLTLAICLLRNLKCCGLNKHFDWNATPQPGDTSLEADICRLRMFRNEISHISSTTGIQQITFQNKWTEIELVLNRLNRCIQNPVQNLQQLIDEYKNNPLDEEAEKRIDAEIEKWQEFEKGLGTEVLLVKKDVQDVKYQVANVRVDVDAVKKQATKEVAYVKEEVNAVKKDVTEEVDNVRKVVHAVNKHVTKEVEKAKEEMQAVKKHVTEEIDNAKEEGHAMKNHVTKAVDKVKEEMKKHVTKEEVEFVKKNMRNVKDDIEMVQEKFAQLKNAKRTQGESEEPVRTKTPNAFQRIFRRIQMPRIKKQLKDELITFYKDRHSTIPLSPLFEEHDTPLLDFYLLPHIKEVQKTFSRGEEIKTPIKSLSDMFKSGSNRGREIYLTADAGFGKTAFSKYLAFTWCQAHRPDDKSTKYFSKDAINAMREYEFLFLVLLRDSSEDCDIDDLIVNQIVQKLSRSSSMTIDSLQEILHSERCLVILDGLDEWTHTEKECSKVPKSIPHRNEREKCTVLTTTRPWKLSVINLNSRQVDKKVELVKLTSQSAKTLKEKAISKIKDVDIEDAKNLTKSLNENIRKSRLDNLESVPLLLMYLICLWCDGVPLGQSKCGLYTSIIELLLSRAMSKHPKKELTCEPSQSDIPQCFSEQVQCKKNCTFLTALGKLALETLTSKKKENSLVFDHSIAEKYLTPDNLDLCLHSGILTQSKQVKLTTQSSKVSFSHKTVQEYFCALYISCQNESDAKKIVLQNCSSIQNILDLSTVFVFISGMNAEIISSISHELMPVINADKITSTYRSRTRYDYRYVNPVKDIQNMYISCLKENPDNSDLKLCCQDFIFDEDCREDSHFTNLKQLAIHNKNNMESVLIQNTGICSLHEIIVSCGVDDLFNIRKIYYEGECKEEEMLRLLNRSVECVTVVSSEWHNDHFIGKRSSCSSKLCKTFQNISLLKAIHIQCFEMNHDVMEQFLNYIINRKSMEEIRLYRLYCIKHRSTCPGFNLDFTKHLHLRTLGFGEVPVLQLKVNVSELECCTVGRLSKPGVVTSYLRSLSAASKLHTFDCGHLESSGDIETLVQTLPLLVTVKEVRLLGINLGEMSPLSPEMTNIELVLLEKVTMSALTLVCIVSVLEKLPHTVTVHIVGCNITPETEFEHVKNYLQTSENFLVTADGIDQFKQYGFVFQTMKN